MKSIFSIIYLWVSLSQMFRFGEAAASLFPDHGKGVVCYRDKEFVEKLQRTDYPEFSSIKGSLLNLQTLAESMSNDRRMCSILGHIMDSLGDDYYALVAKRDSKFEPLFRNFDSLFSHPLTIDEYEGIVSGYKIALSGYARSPVAASPKGIGKLKTMSVVHYVIRGDDTQLYGLLSEEERHLVDSVMQLLTAIIESGSRKEPPATADSTLGQPHKYLPGKHQWYDFFFGIIGNLITWEDAELIQLYLAVVESLLTIDVNNPSSRYSIYRSLMFVNDQIFLDRTIGLPTGDPGDILARIKTYKRILSRLIQRDPPFVLSFEQLEMIDIYDALVGSVEFMESTDFVKRDSLRRNLLLNGVLFALEFDSPKSVIVSIVASVFHKLVKDFPDLKMADQQVARDFGVVINSMRTMELDYAERAEWGEEQMKVGLNQMTWKTPAEIGYFNEEYCLRLKKIDDQLDCENMVVLLKWQAERPEFKGVLVKQGVWFPLQKLNKIILHKIQFGGTGTETMMSLLDFVWGYIEKKLDENGDRANLREERNVLENIVGFSEELAAQSFKDILDTKLEDFAYPSNDALKEYLQLGIRRGRH